MTADQRAWVIVLAALSAFCEIAETVTVLTTYQRTARLGVSIRGVITSRRELDEQRRSDPYQADWDTRKGTISPVDLRDSMLLLNLYSPTRWHYWDWLPTLRVRCSGL